jgi:hypothetical protein
MLAGLFPSEPLVAWDRESLAWHEPAVQTGLASLRAFNPEVAISLLAPYPAVLQALLKASGAALRVAVDAQTPWPFANVRLENDASSYLPARYFQVLSLCRYAGIPAREGWTRIQSGTPQREAAAKEWAKAGRAPERTWLWLQEPGSKKPPDAAWLGHLREKIREREKGEFDLAVVSWNHGFSKGGAARGEVIREVPVLAASTPGEFLGLLDGARGLAAFHGVGLHFASLAEIQCLAFLRREEAAYDVSAWNPMFRAAWLD